MFSVGSEHFLAHRVSYEKYIGPIPAGLHIRHKNDMPLDVNPHNLIPGTPAQNSQDKVARGRQLKGCDHHQAKLTESDVISARNEYYVGRISQAQLARRYGVNSATMRSAILGLTWKHLPGVPGR
ncbi:HNH endonuclease signature motif containing protein [Nocardia aobensis]|uniref:HNH endonuclease signature motif containing protein n=1 Tax=Nocardia aobensis TaxID=257277 RepID=A0ABW6P5W8_9NOCA